MTTLTALFRLATRKGWRTETSGGGWRLTSPDGSAHLYAGATAHWVTLQRVMSTPDLVANLDAARRARWLRQHLRENERLFLKRFALDAAGNLLLVAEAPADTAHMALAPYLFDALANATAPLPEARGGPQDAHDAGGGLPDGQIARLIAGAELLGWGEKSESRGQTRTLGYAGRQRLYEVFLTSTTSWTYFQAPLLTQPSLEALRGASLQTQSRFCAYLLRLNETFYMARLSLVPGEQVVLGLELPTGVVEPPLFHMALQTLGAYIDRYGAELQIMASVERDPKLLNLLSTNHM